MNGLPAPELSSGSRTAVYQSALGCRQMRVLRRGLDVERQNGAGGAGAAAPVAGDAAQPLGCRRGPLFRPQLLRPRADVGPDAGRAGGRCRCRGGATPAPTRWRTSATATWQKIRKSRLRMAYIGAEAASDEALKRMHKGSRVEHTFAVARRCHENGVIPEFSFVLGGPDDPEGEIEQTFEFVRRLKTLHPGRRSSFTSTARRRSAGTRAVSRPRWRPASAGFCGGAAPPARPCRPRPKSGRNPSGSAGCATRTRRG